MSLQVPQTLPNDWLSIQLSHLLLLHVLDILFCILRHPRFSTFTHPLLHLNFNSMFLFLQAYKKNPHTLTERKAHVSEQTFGFLLLQTHTASCPRWLNTEDHFRKSFVWTYEHASYQASRKVQLKSSDTVKKST